MDNSKENYITLKEAAKISGYAPDYIGQLIRKGKLPGKQIYYNVAWMTTEKAIRDYLVANQSDQFEPQKKTWQLPVEKFAKPALYFAIAVLTIFILVLFYIFSANLDKTLDKKTLEKIELR